MTTKKRFKVILHAGLPKTGTTTVQKTLFKNRERLAESGVFVPIFAGKFPGHRKLSALWREPGPTSRKGGTAGVLAGLSESLARARDHNGAVLLCTESMSDPSAAEGASALRRLVSEAGGELRLVAYARQPIDHLPSSIQQESKSYRKRYTPIEKRVFAHIERFENLKKSFDEEAIALRIFDRGHLLKGDIVADLAGFLAMEGLNLPDLEQVDVENESLSGRACALLLSLHDQLASRSVEHAGEVFDDVRGLLIRFESAEGRGPKLKVPQEWEVPLASLVAQRWNALVDEAMLSETDRDAMKLTAATVCDVPSFDRSAWIFSYRDPAYEERFLDFYERKSGAKAGAVRKAILHARRP